MKWFHALIDRQLHIRKVATHDDLNRYGKQLDDWLKNWAKEYQARQNELSAENGRLHKAIHDQSSQMLRIVTDHDLQKESTVALNRIADALLELKK